MHPVYVLSTQTAVLDELTPLLAAKGVSAHPFPTLETLARALRETPSAVVLFDMESLAKDRPMAQVIAQLQKGLDTPLSFLCLFSRPDIRRQVEALRAGAQACVLEPWIPEELTAQLLERCTPLAEKQYKILFLHAAGGEVAAVMAMLEKAGFLVHGVTDPWEILDTLDLFGPNLILIEDTLSPVHCDEMSALIRAHADAALVPILILAWDTGWARQCAARRAGADDLIAVAALEEQLVETVVQRIRRVETVRARLGSGDHEDCASGLYNRRYLFRQLDGILASPDLGQTGHGLLYFEIDILEAPAIDRQTPSDREALLAQFGQLIRAQLTPADIAARLGGYRFALLARRSGVQRLKKFGERLRQAFAEQILELGRLQLRVSANLVVIPLTQTEGLLDARTLVARGREACARMRQGHREDPATVKTTAMERERERRLVKMIRQALEEEGLAMMFQPIAATGEQRQEHYDTLLRLRAKNGELIMPETFLPVAEQHGLMPAVNRWVLQHALNLLAERLSHAMPTRLIVRQAMADIHPQEWVLWLHRQIKERKLAENLPILEFQLEDLLANLDVANTRFRILNQIGVDFCISRFNDQPAAKSLLGDLPITLIRPDIALLSEDFSGTRLERLIQYAHDHKTKVIAGSIEGFEDVSRAWQSKADFILGFFVQPPLEHLAFDFTEAH